MLTTFKFWLVNTSLLAFVATIILGAGCMDDGMIGESGLTADTDKTPVEPSTWMSVTKYDEPYFFESPESDSPAGRFDRGEPLRLIQVVGDYCLVRDLAGRECFVKTRNLVEMSGPVARLGDGSDTNWR